MISLRSTHFAIRGRVNCLSSADQMRLQPNHADRMSTTTPPAGSSSPTLQRKVGIAGAEDVERAVTVLNSISYNPEMRKQLFEAGCVEVFTPMLALDPAAPLPTNTYLRALRAIAKLAGQMEDNGLLQAERRGIAWLLQGLQATLEGKPYPEQKGRPSTPNKYACDPSLPSVQSSVLISQSLQFEYSRFPSSVNCSGLKCLMFRFA